MPTYRIETSQGTFDIEADREPTPQEVEAQLAGSSPAGSMPAGPVADPSTYSVARQALDASMNAQGMPGLGTAANLIRVGSSFIGGAGGLPGAAAGGGGEAVAQMLESGTIDRPGEVAASGAVSAIPMAKPVATVGKWVRAGKNALRMAGGAAGGEEVRSLIDDGKLSNPLQEAGVAGGLSLLAPVAGKAVGKLTNNVDAADAERMASDMRRNAPRDAALKGGRELGMVVPPTAVNDTWFNRRIEGLAGGPRVVREVNIRNEKAGGSAIRQDLGMSPDATVTPGVLKSKRKLTAEPMRRVEALSDNGGITMYHGGNGGMLSTDPVAVKASGAMHSAKVQPKNPLVIEGDQVAMLESRAQLDPNWKENAFARGHDAIIIDNGTGRIDAFVPDQPGRAAIYHGSPVATAKADLQELSDTRKRIKANKRAGDGYDPAKERAWLDKAKALEDRIEVAAIQSGDAKLLKELKDAKRMYAKLKLAGKMLSDRGEFHLNQLADISQKAADRGSPLDGNMAKVGSFAGAFERRLTRPAASLPNPGVSSMEASKTLFGAAMGGIKGAALGTFDALVRAPVQGLVLSPLGQRALATPNYKPGTTFNSDFVDAMQRLSSKVALLSHEGNSFIPPARR